MSTPAVSVGIGLGVIKSPKPGGGVEEPGGAGSSTPGGPSRDDLGKEEMPGIVDGIAEGRVGALDPLKNSKY